MYNPVLCYVSDYLFLATLQTLLLSLPSASFRSHSNLKIEISLLGSMDVIAGISFGLCKWQLIYRNGLQICYFVLDDKQLSNSKYIHSGLNTVWINKDNDWFHHFIRLHNDSENSNLMVPLKRYVIVCCSCFPFIVSFIIRPGSGRRIA